MRKIWLILIAGILLRIFLSYSTFHPDTLAFKLGGEVVASGKILNLYDFSDPNIAVLNYPPLIYFFHGLFNFIGGFLGGTQAVKLPYIIFDILAFFVFLRLFPLAKDASLAVALWIFNPINLYATYMMGQFDIIPTFFTLLSVYFAAKKRLYASALALGFGIAFKLYPLFFIIPLILLSKNFLERVKLVILAALPYTLSVIPYIGSPSFRENALLTSQTSKSLYAAIPVSGGESILLFPLFLILFYMMILKKDLVSSSVWKFYSIPLLLFFIFTHFHPQWLIWLSPFLIIDLVSNRFKNLLPISIAMVCWFISLFFFDPSLSVRLFAPLFPGLQNVADIWTLLNLSIDYNFLRSLVQSIFSAALIYLLYKFFPTNEYSKSK